MRQNPPLSSGSARERADSEHHRHQAILHVMENGCKWRALPERFGKWYTVYARFRRWSQSGVLQRLFAVLREQQAVGEDAERFGLDSTSVKVHPDGTGARKTSGPQSIGKSHDGGTRRSTSSRQVTVTQ